MSENLYFSLSVGDTLALDESKYLLQRVADNLVFLILFFLKSRLYVVNKEYIKQISAKVMFPTICSFATLKRTYLE